MIEAVLRWVRVLSIVGSEWCTIMHRRSFLLLNKVQIYSSYALMNSIKNTIPLVNCNACPLQTKNSGSNIRTMKSRISGTTYLNAWPAIWSLCVSYIFFLFSVSSALISRIISCHPFKHLVWAWDSISECKASFIQKSSQDPIHSADVK